MLIQNTISQQNHYKPPERYISLPPSKFIGSNMGSHYGTGWLDMLYDIEAQVKETKPSRTLKTVHDIRPEKYLAVPKTRKIFSGEYFDTAAEIGYRIKGGTCLSECNVGEIYPVTLKVPLADIESELNVDDSPISDSVNSVIFNPGEFEERIHNAKVKLFGSLRVAGIVPEEKKIYYALSALAKSF